MTKTNKTSFVFTKDDVYGLIAKYLIDNKFVSNIDIVTIDSFRDIDEMSFEITGNADFCVRAETETKLEGLVLIGEKHEARLSNSLYEN